MITKLTLLAAALALGACGTHSLSTTKDSTTKTLVEGKWVSPCLYNSEPDATTGERGDKSTKQSWIVFTGTDVTSVTKSYDKEKCDTLVFSAVTSSTYKLSDHPTNKDLKLIDYTIKSITLSFHDQDTVDQLNDIEFCKFKDWKLNTPRGVTGLACFDDATFLPKIGGTVLDLVQLKNDQLFFGRPLSGDLMLPGVGNAAGQRPTAVSVTEFVGIDTAP